MNRINYLVFLIAFGLVLTPFGSMALAQDDGILPPNVDDSNPPSVSPDAPLNPRPVFDGRRDQIQDEFRAHRDDRNDAFRSLVDERHSQIQDALQNQDGRAAEIREQLRADFDGRAAEIRSQFQTRRDSLDSRRTDLIEARDTRRSELGDRVEERRNRFQEQTRDRLNAFVRRAIEHLQNAVARLDNAANRVGSRIEKLEANGFDLSEASRLLEVALDEIDLARDEVAEIPGALDDILESDDPRAAFGVFKEVLRSARDAVRAAHTALVDAIEAIKATDGLGSDVDNDDTDNPDDDTNSDDTDATSTDADPN